MTEITELKRRLPVAHAVKLEDTQESCDRITQFTEAEYTEIRRHNRVGGSIRKIKLTGLNAEGGTLTVHKGQFVLRTLKYRVPFYSVITQETFEKEWEDVKIGQYDTSVKITQYIDDMRQAVKTWQKDAERKFEKQLEEFAETRLESIAHKKVQQVFKADKGRSEALDTFSKRAGETGENTKENKPRPPLEPGKWYCITQIENNDAMLVKSNIDNAVSLKEYILSTDFMFSGWDASREYPLFYNTHLMFMVPLSKIRLVYAHEREGDTEK